MKTESRDSDEEDNDMASVTLSHESVVRSACVSLDSKQFVNMGSEFNLSLVKGFGLFGGMLLGDL